MVVDTEELIPNTFLKAFNIKLESELPAPKVEVEKGIVELENNQKVSFVTAFAPSRRNPISEDSHLNLLDKNLAAICDGMGGHENGEGASQMAVSLMKEFYGSVTHFHTQNQAEEFLVDAINTVNERLYKAFNEEEHLKAPRGEKVPLKSGTTIIASYFRFDPIKENHTAILGSVGDSRALQFDSSGLHNLTKVDSEAIFAHPTYSEKEQEELQERLDNTVDPAVLNELDRKLFESSVIIQALGCKEVHPHISRTEVKPGDYLLLTSDGILGCITLADIDLTLKDKGLNDEEKAKELILKAQKRLWPQRWHDDDSTVTLIHFLPKT